MESINFNEFFENCGDYRNPKTLIIILEDIIGKSFKEIKKCVIDSKVVVTEEQIRKFLEQKLIEENPELKKRMENPTDRRSNNLAEWTEQDIEDSAQRITDSFVVGRYEFDSFTLRYFITYTTIVRKKVIKLLNLIQRISNKKVKSIQNTLLDLDIVLDENGNILKSDIVRLIEPIIYNINVLNKKSEEANDLSTYLKFKLSEAALYRDGICEGELYPRSSIQINSLENDYNRGNVRLSEKQRKTLEEERSISLIKSAKFLCDIFD